MMSTKDNCFFERGEHPSFHYSTTGRSAEFGIDTSRADVLVISGYGGSCINGRKTEHPSTCFYNGTEYKTGDVWKDGCDYECKCINANKGYWYCVPLCPAGKYLDARPGHCCKDQATVPKDDIPVECLQAQAGPTTPPSPMCSHKGKEYKTGDVWQDGCEQNCTCVDATLNAVQCVALCPSEKNLPYGCYIDKKPGQCCGELTCPNGKLILTKGS